jgi:hypothetical protein
MGLRALDPASAGDYAQLAQEQLSADPTTQGYVSSVGVQTDPRDKIFGAIVSRLAGTSAAAQELRQRVVNRRNSTYRATELKEETVASLRIVAGKTDPGGDYSNYSQVGGGMTIFGTDQFVLQSAAESDSERVQIVETFGEPVVFFYGRRPRVFNYNGFLFNSGKTSSLIPAARTTAFQTGSGEQSKLWRDNFKMAYDLFLRGTKCVEFKARCYLTYDRVVREGFLIGMAMNQDMRPNMVQLSFQMFVMREINVDSVIAMAANTLDGVPAPASPSDADPAAVAARVSEGGRIFLDPSDDELLGPVAPPDFTETNRVFGTSF